MIDISAEVICLNWPTVGYTRSWHTGMRYWKQCLQAPLLPLSPAPTRFSRKFSRSAFHTILEPGTDYAETRVGFYIFIYLDFRFGVRNDVLKRQTDSVVLTIFPAVFSEREMVLARNFDCRRILQKTLKQFGPVAAKWGWFSLATESESES